MNPLSGGAILGSDGTAPVPPLLVILKLLGNSIVLGVILCVVTYTLGRLLRNAEKARKTPTKSVQKFVDKFRARRQQHRVRTLVASSNLLFLCVGLTGTMILVNNTMVRAFAIGAAIALVRFKVNLNGRDSNSALLFGILSGIACGLNELTLAWTLILIHGFLSALVALGPKLITLLVPQIKGAIRPVLPEAARSISDLARLAPPSVPSVSPNPALSKKKLKHQHRSVREMLAAPLGLIADTAKQLSSAHIQVAPVTGPRD